jgi:hypothetical protein
MTPHTDAMIDVHALSRLAFARRVPRAQADPQPSLPGDPGQLGGLTNEEIDSLLDRFDGGDAGRASRAA